MKVAPTNTRETFWLVCRVTAVANGALYALSAPRLYYLHLTHGVPHLELFGAVPRVTIPMLIVLGAIQTAMLEAILAPCVLVALRIRDRLPRWLVILVSAVVSWALTRPFGGAFVE